MQTKCKKMKQSLDNKCKQNTNKYKPNANKFKQPLDKKCNKCKQNKNEWWAVVAW